MDPELIRRQSRLEARGWWFRGRADIITALLPAPNGARTVLDVGCGWGGLADRLSPWGKVVGVEPSAAAREEASRRGLTVLDGRADALPVEDASVEIVIAGDVLEHLDDDVAAIREIARVLRPDGVALITVPAYPRLFSGHDRALGHRRRYTRPALLEAVVAGGLEPTRVTHFNSILLPAAAARRLLSRNRVGGADSAAAGRPIDGLLYRVLRLERRLLRRFDLPIGLSIALLAGRPERGAGSPAHASLREVLTL